MHGRVDGMVLLIALAAVLVGTVVGTRSTVYDVDQQLYESVIHRMQDGESFYTATAEAIRDKGGVPPSQVRSVRTPVVALVVSAFPPSWWRWLAAIPAFALCLLSAALAGESLLAQRLAAGLTGIWMITCLPLLYLHQELWGAPLLVGSALALRRDRDPLAAGLSLAATAVRELYGLSLVVGLLLRRRRPPWIAAIALAIAGAVLHAHWASPVLDPAGFDPPLHAFERYTVYLAPSDTVPAEVLGVALLVLAVVGTALRWGDPAFRYLALVAAPLIVATALSGRPYWALTWCGPVCAAAAVAIANGVERVGWRRAVEAT